MVDNGGNTIHCECPNQELNTDSNVSFGNVTVADTITADTINVDTLNADDVNFDNSVAHSYTLLNDADQQLYRLDSQTPGFPANRVAQFKTAFGTGPNLYF